MQTSKFRTFFVEFFSHSFYSERGLGPGTPGGPPELRKNEKNKAKAKAKANANASAKLD